MLCSDAKGPFVACHAVNSVADWPSQTCNTSSVSTLRTGASIDALLDDWLSSYTDCSSDDDDGFNETDSPAYRPPSFPAPVALALTALQEGEGTYDPRETSSGDPTRGGAEPGAVPSHAAAALVAVGPAPLNDFGFLRPCDTESSSSRRANQALFSTTTGLHSAATRRPSDGGSSTHTTATVMAAKAAVRYGMYDTSTPADDGPMEIRTPARTSADVDNQRAVTGAAAANVHGGCHVGAGAAGDGLYPSNIAGATTFMPNGLTASLDGAQRRLSSLSDDAAHLALLAFTGQMSWRWSWPAMSPQPSAKKHPRQPTASLDPRAADLHRGQQQPQEEHQPCVYGAYGAPSRTDAGVWGCGSSDPAGRKAVPRWLPLAPPLRWPEGAFPCPRLSAPTAGALHGPRLSAPTAGALHGPRLSAPTAGAFPCPRLSGPTAGAFHCPRLSAPTAGARHSCPPGQTDMREFEEMMAWMSQAAWREGPSDAAPASPLATHAAVTSGARNPTLLWAGDTANPQYACASGRSLLQTVAVAAPPAEPGYRAAEPQPLSSLHPEAALGLSRPSTAAELPPEWACAVGKPWAGLAFPQPAGPGPRPPWSANDDGIAYGACQGPAQPNGTERPRRLLPPRSEHRDQLKMGPQGLSSKLWSPIQQVEGASTAPLAAPAAHGCMRPSPQQQQPAALRQVGSAAERELQVGWESGAPTGGPRGGPFLPGAGQPEVHAATVGTVTWAPCGLIAGGVPASKRACLCGPCEHAYRTQSAIRAYDSGSVERDLDLVNAYSYLE